MDFAPDGSFMVAGVSGESRGTPFSSLFTWNLLTRYGPDVMLKIAEIEVRSLTDLALSPDMDMAHWARPREVDVVAQHGKVALSGMPAALPLGGVGEPCLRDRTAKDDAFRRACAGFSHRAKMAPLLPIATRYVGIATEDRSEMYVLLS